MQTVSSTFSRLANGGVRPISWALRMSFDKSFDDSAVFFTLDTSTLDSVDMLSPSDNNPLQEWDFYEYTDYNDRIINIGWSRYIDFPYSVTAATADLKLNNYDDYFTPNSSSPIEQYILPKRPLRILMGFNNINIPQFVGMTETIPRIDRQSKTADFHALDFLSEIFSMPINETIAMSDVTTDVVLAALLEQFGLTPSQYSLAKGRNVIPFLFFEKGSNAGDVIRLLMQAEMGSLWLNELGIVVFEERLQRDQTPVMTFDDSNVISITTTAEDEIINYVRIISDIRVVQDFQPIWSKSSSGGSNEKIIVPASSTLEVVADLSDPALDTVVAPVIGVATNTSWFTAKTMAGGDVSSNISVTSAELKTNTYTMTFTNNNPYPVEIYEAEVWGEPAKVVDSITYELKDDVSIAKYGEKVLEIDNNFIQSEENCDALAYTILDAYSGYAGMLEMSVKGNPALELGDIIHVGSGDYNDDYKIVSIVNALQSGNYQQTIKARHYTARDWFFLDESILNGTSVLAP